MQTLSYGWFYFWMNRWNGRIDVIVYIVHNCKNARPKQRCKKSYARGRAYIYIREISWKNVSRSFVCFSFRQSRVQEVPFGFEGLKRFEYQTIDSVVYQFGFHFDFSILSLFTDALSYLCKVLIKKNYARPIYFGMFALRAQT